MGAYLSSPVTEKASEEGENENFSYGVCAMQGWRTEMEDAHSILLEMENSSKTGFFGVFDGHGGKEVARFVALYLARELASLEEFRAGDMQKALGRAYLRMDELLVMDDHEAELRKLAGEADHPGPAPGRRRPKRAPTMVLDEAELPEVLRDALRDARKRAAERRARKAAAGEGGADDGPDDVEEFDVADLITGEFGGDEDDDDEEDPDYSPADAADEDMGPGELVDLEIDSEAERAVLAEAPPTSGLSVRTGRSRRDIAVATSEAEAMDADAATAAAAVTEKETSSEETGEEGGGRNGAKRKRLEGQRGSGGRSRAAAAQPNGNPASKGGQEGGGGEQEAGDEAAAEADEEDSGLSSSDDSDEVEVEVQPRQPGFRGPCAGCTAVVAVVRGAELWVANAGDSRCVCSRRGLALALSHDHKPTDEEELQRISRAGGFVAEGRINGSLNLSRALGDMDYKQSKDLGPAAQMVTAVPEVRALRLEPGDEFLILACDGIWDVLSNQQAVDFVRKRLAQRMSPRAISEALCDHCLAPDTAGCGKGCDNMSALVVVLKHFSPFSSGDKEVDLATLPPPPAPEELDPMFLDHSEPPSDD
ncbi:g9418 [Coccomyxa elongata]